MLIPWVNHWRRWALLTAAVALGSSCGDARPDCLSSSEAGGATGGDEHEGTPLCAPECLLFCGTKEECSPSSGGEGGAPAMTE